MMHLSLRANDFLSGLFFAVGIKLIDFKLEFGRWWPQDEMRLVVADEISPDQLPPVGHRDQRDHGQGQVPAATSEASRRPTRRWPAGSASCPRAAARAIFPAPAPCSRAVQ